MDIPSKNKPAAGRYALLDENEVGCVRAVCDEQLRPLEAAP